MTNYFLHDPVKCNHDFEPNDIFSHAIKCFVFFSTSKLYVTIYFPRPLIIKCIYSS